MLILTRVIVLEYLIFLALLEATPPVTTPNRIAANARNAQHSTGPKSVEGKRTSSMNALKHGLTAKMAVLPNEKPEEFDDRLVEWLDFYQPPDPAQAAVIERAVASKWKLDRCTRVETERLSEKVRHAEAQYDLDKMAEAEILGRRLIYEPINRCDVPQVHDPVVRKRLEARDEANPAILSRQLQMTAQGTQWLIDRWIELAEMLRLHGFWHYPEKLKVIWMLGKRPEDVLEDVTVQRIFLACNVVHPDCSETKPDSFSFFDDCFQAKLGLQGKPMYIYQVDQVSTLKPPDEKTARAKLWELFTNEVTRLRALKENHLDPLDRLDRASAPDRAMFDDSKAGVLLRRYETACEREFHRSIADLLKLRKEPPPEQVMAPERNEAIAEEPTAQAVASIAPAASMAPAPENGRQSHVDVSITVMRAVSEPETALRDTR
jgi:hypothetical protein